MSATATAQDARAEAREVVALAREIGRRSFAPRALELDERRPGALEAAWGRVAGVGFDRALLAVEDGGVGLDAPTFLGCLEEIAAGDGGVALLVLLSNAALAALPPERLGAIGEAERWALVPAPPDGLATRAGVAVRNQSGSGPTVSGTLAPALGALGADAVVIATRGRGAALLALPAGGPGMEIEQWPAQLGLRSAAAARISLANAPTERANPQGDQGDAAASALSLLQAGGAAISRGVARRARELALGYAQERVQGGVAIVEHDAVRRILAAMTLGIAGIPAPGADALDPTAALVAKVAASEAAVSASRDAVQVFGGTGYMRETGVEKLMRDAKCLQLWPEPNWMADDPIVDATLPS